MFLISINHLIYLRFMQHVEKRKIMQYIEQERHRNKKKIPKCNYESNKESRELKVD